MKLLELPRLRQTYDYDCGATVLESILVYYGIDVREDILMKNAGTTKDGTPIPGILKTVKKYGLKYVSKQMDLEEIKGYLDKKIPIILLIQAWTKKKMIDWKKDWMDGHYAVAVGYDRNKIYFEDPSSFKLAYLTYKELEMRWHDVDIKGKKYFNHGIAIYGKHNRFQTKSMVHMK